MMTPLTRPLSMPSLPAGAPAHQTIPTAPLQQPLPGPAPVTVALQPPRALSVGQLLSSLVQAVGQWVRIMAPYFVEAFRAMAANARALFTKP